jgi:predicted nucleic acid-binding protein
MTGPVLLDTGPLVASLLVRERHHLWVKEQFATLTSPLLTCEAVLTEACFLVSERYPGPDAVLEMVRRGAVKVTFSLGEEVEAIEELLVRYRNVPIDFADACLVRMAELTPRSTLLTFDGDFSIYRIHGRKPIPRLMPPE